MADSVFQGMAEAAAGLLAILGGVAWVLRRRQIASSQGKTAAQVQARFSAMLQFRATLYRCVPGALILFFGIFYTIDRSSQREPDGWNGLLFIPVGWVLIPHCTLSQKGLPSDPTAT